MAHTHSSRRITGRPPAVRTHAAVRVPSAARSPAGGTSFPVSTSAPMIISGRPMQESDHGVQFTQNVDMGLDREKAFPFLYTLVNTQNDPSVLPANTSPPVPGALGNIGPLVNPGAKVTVPVVLDPDYNFKLLGIKYETFYWNNRRSCYEWYEATSDVLGTLDELTGFIGTPYNNYLRVTISLQGSGSCVLYGDQTADPLNAGPYPMPVNLMQGYDYGFTRVRTPRLLPKQGIITVDLNNTHATKALYAGAVLYGMKVRI